MSHDGRREERLNVSSGGPWEELVGYSRAVRVGPHVHVSGTTAMTPHGVMGGRDPHAQTLQALRTIAEALHAAGAGLEHVVRTRTYVVDMAHWEHVARAHGEVFGTIKPASTLVQVAGLIHPELLVEIEADAHVTG